jgi:hypothetical protein
MVKAGDSIPAVELVEKSPGNKVSLAKELASGKGLIVGVPAAFSKCRIIALVVDLVYWDFENIRFLCARLFEIWLLNRSLHLQAHHARPVTCQATSTPRGCPKPGKSLSSVSTTHSCK